MTTESAHSDAVEPAGFAIHLPDGFIELPTGEPDQQKLTGLASALAVRFGLPADAEIDQGLAETAAMLMALGASSEAGGSQYTAAGIFRSARAERPLMAVVSCFVLPSEHDSPRTALSGLEQYYRNDSGVRLEPAEFSAGEAVLVSSVSTDALTLGDRSAEATKHALTAWIPDPSATGMLGVAVTSNNGEDWADIADMASGIFETVEWLPQDDPETPSGATRDVSEGTA